MNDNVIPFRPSTPMDALLSMQKAWMDQSMSWWQYFSMPALEQLNITAGDVNIHYPFGQGFTLFANPATSWFDIMATGEPGTEQKIVTGVASYGKQLGRIMDVLLPLAEKSGELDEDDVKALRRMRDEIEAVKTSD